jgi:O-antigen/teichoic acid export membrane protein
MTSPSLPRNLGWSVFKNTAAQVVGRGLIAVSRLVVAGIIVRSFGRDMFGAYSLVFGLMVIAEWLLDFGVTEVFVREICREPEKAPRLLRIVTAAKSVQILAAYATLVAILVALRYPADIVQAALVGGAGMVFYAGVLVYRIIYRSSLTMERDVLAELVSVVVMIPLLWWACRQGASLTVLVACHVVARGVFLLLSFLFGKSRYRPSVKGVTWADVRWSLKISIAIGTAGFLVGIYETLDILLLSKLGTLSDLGYYSGAQRLVWPVLIVLASVGATLYPVVATYWPAARDEFEKAFQKGLNTVLVLGGAALCTLFAGAEFFMGLIGPEMVGGAPALRVLALLCFFKAISATVGPVLYVIHAQRHALWIIGLATLVKIAVVAPLVPPFGYMGVAAGTLFVEVCFAVVPTVLVVQRLTQYRIKWLVPLKVAVIAAAVAAAAYFLVPGDGLLAAIVAGLLYVPLVFAARAVTMSDVRTLLKRGES